MEIIVVENEEEGSKLLANRIQRLIKNKPDSCIGFATGSTPLETYRMLVQKTLDNKISWEGVRAFNLDEYVGLGAEHKASYAHYMIENLFSKINIKKENCFIPNGLAIDIVKECELYEQAIQEQGPIDLQILGLGRDGHIGFNEPISSLQSRTRLKTLTEETRKDNSSYFEQDQIPYHVITMGIATIMEAREIVMLAFGEAKAEAVVLSVEGPLQAMVPASALQNHIKATVIVDEKAAALLKNKDYYNWVFTHKPEWQKKNNF